MDQNITNKRSESGFGRRRMSSHFNTAFGETILERWFGFCSSSFYLCYAGRSSTQQKALTFKQQAKIISSCDLNHYFI